jgi:hypothetical protein
MIKKKALIEIYILALVLYFFPGVVLSEESWVSDPKTNCRVEGRPMFAGAIIQWRGNCVEGKAEGSGTLEWFAEGVKYWTETFSERSGVLLRGGKRVSVLKADQVELKLTKCDKGIGYRHIEVRIPPDIDARQGVLISELLSWAERFAWDKCPAKEALSDKTRLSNVAVTMLQNEKKIAWARSYPKNLLSPSGDREWRESSYDLFNSSVANAQRLVATAQAEKQKQQMLGQEQARKDAEARSQAEVVKRRLAFIEKHSVNTWLSAGDLAVNPFQFEGKIVAVRTKLSQMVTPTRGIFSGDFVVSEIPTNKIVDQKELIIAGKVRGNISVKTPFGGEVLLPHLDYNGVYFCQEHGCRDIDLIK